MCFGGKPKTLIKWDAVDGHKEVVQGILGISDNFEHENYLGLPLTFGRSRSKELRYMV